MLDTDATPPAGTEAEAGVDPDPEAAAFVEPEEAAPAPSWLQRQEPWSVAALACAIIGVIPWTWPVPLLSLAAVAFALFGWRRHQLDAALPNRWMAVVALYLGLATLAALMVATAFGKVSFLPFWTEPPT